MTIEVEESDQMADKNGRAAWGTYTSVFWKFYESDDKTLKSEYGTTNDACLAQISMLRTISRKHIYDIRITRRKNVLYLEKTELIEQKVSNSPQWCRTKSVLF